MSQRTTTDDGESTTLPEWVPAEYDPDAPLRERLPIMANIEGGIQLHVADDRGIEEIVGEPHDITETRGTLTLKAGGTEFNWNFEIVVPEEGEAFLRSVNPDQDVEDYFASRTKELEGIDVRIYGVDTDRLEHGGDS